MKNFLVISFLILAQLASGQNGFPVNKTVKTLTVFAEIDKPWGIDFLPNGDMLVTEIQGKLYRIVNGKATEIKGVPAVVAEGQGGLMDVKVHPKYATNGWIYLTYSKGGQQNEKGQELATTALVRAKIENNQLTQIQELFVAEPWSTLRHHYGSRIVFDQQGYLYLSVGDRGKHFENPQKLDNHCGKIHRLNDDGSIPADNPFVKNFAAMPSIFAYGNRNSQGMVIHPTTGALWEHEHGPKGGDEINIIEKGKNYGWPVISYGINYNGTVLTKETAREGMEQPLIYWVPSIAPSGMEFISSDRYGAAWKGNLLVGSLSFQYLNRCIIENGKVTKQEKLLEDIGRVRSIRQGPDGYIYLGVEGKGVLKLVVE